MGPGLAVAARSSPGVVCPRAPASAPVRGGSRPASPSAGLRRSAGAGVGESIARPGGVCAA
eukprot:2983907-Alexandrium_andersonii.AAC.1